MVDIVDKLLAAVGESTLLVSLMRLGVLEHIEGMEIPKVAIRTDENHLAVVTVGIGEQEFPQRLVLDQDFGWLWYSADGPVENLS